MKLEITRPYMMVNNKSLLTGNTHILHPDLQVCHVRLEVLGHLVSLVVEGKPAVHKCLDLQENTMWY